MDPCKNLWMAVLEQAMEDILTGPAHRRGKVESIFKNTALAWFHSDNEGIGSFLWVCEHLDIDPHTVHHILTKKIGAPKGLEAGVG